MQEAKQLTTQVQNAALTGGLQIKTMDDLARLAKMLSACNYFEDAKDASQAGVKVLAGLELGIPAMAAMTGISIVKGKPVMSANLMAACVKRNDKYNYKITKHTTQECDIEFFEGGESVGTSSFTITEAQTAGLAGKDNWKNYPKNMLFARALSNGVKWYASDIFLGAPVYTEDELPDTSDSYQEPAKQPEHIAEGQVVTVEAEIVPEKEMATSPIKTLESTEPKSKAGQMMKEGMEEQNKESQTASVADLVNNETSWVSDGGLCTEPGCNLGVTTNVAAHSEKQYGKVLCWEHQPHNKKQ